MSFDPNMMEGDAKIAEDVLDEFDKSIPDFLKGEVPGTRTLSLLEKREFLSRMMQQYPPEVFVNEETGETLRISAWSLAMRFAEGGQEMLDELERAFRPDAGAV